MELTTILPQEKQFYVNNGPVVSSAEGLAAALDGGEISKESYAFHQERGDFQRWINDVYEQQSLAKAIAKLKTPKSCAKKIKEAL